MAEQVTIDGHRYECTVDRESGCTTLRRESTVLEVRDWTWGEKNDVVSGCSYYTDRTGELEVDSGRYYEAMLTTCIATYHVDGQDRRVTQAALRALPAREGDHLASVVQYVLDGAGQRSDPVVTGAADERIVEIDGMTFALREWTWGEKNDVSAASIRYEPAADAYTVDVAVFNELMLCACITRAPFEIGRSSLRALPARIGDLLLDEVQGFSMLEDDVKKNSVRPSVTAAATPR